MDQTPNKDLQITFKLPDELRMKETTCKVIACVFEHPDWSQKQIADCVGITQSRVSVIINSDKVRDALPLVARQRMGRMVPKAMQVTQELLGQKENLEVARKVSERVLAESKVLDAPTLLIKSELTVKSTQELEQMINASKVIPPHVIEAEFTEDTTQGELHTKQE